MRVIREMIKMNLKIFVQHRMAFFMTLIMQSAVILIYISLFRSIYVYNGTELIKGYTLSQMIWYFATANFVTACVLNFVDRRLSSRILSGQLSIDLMRPVRLFVVELAQALSLRIVGVIIEFLLAFLIYLVIYFPSFLTLGSFCRFIVLIIGSFALSFLMNYLIGLAAFFLTNSNSLSRLKVFIISFAGGAFIPLEFFPVGWNVVLDFLPFKFIYYWPIQTFLNRGQTGEAVYFAQILIAQWSWVIALGVLSFFLEKQMVRKYCAVGG